jgi:hypothetical protein
MLHIGVVFVEGAAHGFSVDHEVEGDDEDDEEEGGQAVAPDVDALVVEHEEAAEDAFGSVEVYAVAVGDMVVVLHIAGSGLIVSDEMGLLGGRGVGGGGGFLLLFLFKFFLNS